MRDVETSMSMHQIQGRFDRLIETLAWYLHPANLFSLGLRHVEQKHCLTHDKAVSTGLHTRSGIFTLISAFNLSDRHSARWNLTFGRPRCSGQTDNRTQVTFVVNHYTIKLFCYANAIVTMTPRQVVCSHQRVCLLRRYKAKMLSAPGADVDERSTLPVTVRFERHLK